MALSTPGSRVLTPDATASCAVVWSSRHGTPAYCLEPTIYIGPEDLFLASSLNLRCIWFKQANGEEDYALEAVARITGRLAPNLSHVRACRALVGSSLELLRAWETPRNPFQMCVPAHVKAAGVLKQLEVRGSRCTSVEDLEIGTECTNFKLLQTYVKDVNEAR